ncbi:YncE family protein [Prevotella fusca]|uniref:Cell surface protein n=1 Tax=Prevotella fusca JCM 17724 TaxID=1236517 RepID=A0A0K1NII8_9BACT|nr:hypothetical protein [Prevotella fusca]AKU68917.1 hypothetical protein ADJ77_03580 [Prevotella fusca JCM 17724]QUB86538.1 hypothetical protein J5A51_10705 [Prevotella fusca JCM 17724]
MKKNLLALGIILMSALTFTACSDDNDFDNGTQPEVTSPTTYVSCAGNWKQNDGTIGILFYNATDRPKSPFRYYDAYTAQNGEEVGDAQDLIVFGNKVVITSTTSSKIEILNRLGRLEKKILMPKVEPRYLATDGKYVYFSAYSGKIYKMNPNDMQKPIVDSVEVGPYPEAISVANGKLYANMSDHNYDNKGKSISIVDLSSFKKVKEVEVALNPYNQSIAVGNDIYFVSAYHSENALVQKIDATTDKVTSVCKASAIAYNIQKNALVCLYATYYDTNKRFFVHDLKTGTETNIDMTGLQQPQQVNVDNKGYIYVIDNPSYKAPSEVFYYSPEGKLIQGNIKVGYSAQNVRFAN